MPDAHVRAGPDPSHRRNLWTFPLPSCKSLAACDMRRGVSYVRISSSSPYQREAANGSKPLQRLSLESAHGVFGVSPQCHLFFPEAPYDHLERCNESDKRRAEESERHWPANECRRRGWRHWAWGDRRDCEPSRRVAL